MIGLGTLINAVAIVIGGILGHFTGRFFKEDQQDAITKACGISVLFIATAGAMEGMLEIIQSNVSEIANSTANTTASLQVHTQSLVVNLCLLYCA